MKSQKLTQACQLAIAFASASFVGAQPAKLQVGATNPTTIAVQWDTGGTLQFAPSILGPWSSVTAGVNISSAATSPVNSPARFFRVVDHGVAGSPVPIFPTQLPKPLRIQGASVQQLRAPQAAGNSVMEVRFEQGQRSVSNSLDLLIGDRITTLRDDGLFPDREARDQTFSAVIDVSLDELKTMNAGINSLIPSRRFSKIFEGRDVVGTNSLRLFPIEEFLAGARIPFFTNGPFGPTHCAGSPLAYDWRKTVMITDISVVQDSARTWDPCPSPVGTGTMMGPWTFGRLMTDMANTPVTGVDPSDFVLNWLRSWEFAQSINSDLVPARPQVKAQVVQDWLAASAARGFPPNKLDLSVAPFRLLAIVNRVDLRGNTTYGGSSSTTAEAACLGGEARFVFGVTDRNCNPLPFTVILEYCVPKNTCPELKAWAQQWAALDGIPFSPAYNAALQAITDQFAKANANPSHLPNKSAINQIRSNEILGPEWDLREWRLAVSGVDAGFLREMPVKQTPAFAHQSTPLLHNFITANNASLCSGSTTIPLIEAGMPFLGGSAPMPSPSFFWTAPGLVPGEFCARHKLSLNTCNGCHAGETSTPFTHVGPRSQNFPASLSGFLLGITVNDPVDLATTHTFADLDRRVEDLNKLATCPCFFGISFVPLLMEH